MPGTGRHSSRSGVRSVPGPAAAHRYGRLRTLLAKLPGLVPGDGCVFGSSELPSARSSLQTRVFPRGFCAADRKWSVGTGVQTIRCYWLPLGKFGWQPVLLPHSQPMRSATVFAPPHLTAHRSARDGLCDGAAMTETADT